MTSQTDSYCVPFTTPNLTRLSLTNFPISQQLKFKLILSLVKIFPQLSGISNLGRLSPQGRSQCLAHKDE